MRYICRLLARRPQWIRLRACAFTLRDAQIRGPGFGGLNHGMAASLDISCRRTFLVPRPTAVSFCSLRVLPHLTRMDSHRPLPHSNCRRRTRALDDCGAMPLASKFCWHGCIRADLPCRPTSYQPIVVHIEPGGRAPSARPSVVALKANSNLRPLHRDKWSNIASRCCFLSMDTDNAAHKGRSLMDPARFPRFRPARRQMPVVTVVPAGSIGARPPCALEIETYALTP
jgi:hypothetical protein